MSHFAILVIGPDYKAQMAPYYVEDNFAEVEVTETIAKEFNEPVQAVRLANGKILSRDDDFFYTGVTIDNFFRQPQASFVLPDDAEEITLSASEARDVGLGHASMDEAAQYYYGEDIIIRDGCYFDLKNPQAKWDWYELGGRWTGLLKLKPNKPGVLGTSGIRTSLASEFYLSNKDGYADQALKGDIDFEQMRNDAEVKARTLWTLAREITSGTTWDSWDDTLIRYPDITRARREYCDQPAIELLHASGKDVFKWSIDDDLALDLETYIQRRRDASCVYFAFVRDGIWTEKGAMGWFASVSDEISDAQWNRLYNDMLDALPDDTLLSLVDCHI